MNSAIQEIEHHLHNVEIWIEPIDPALRVAGVNEAVVAGTRPAVAAPYFQIDAGNVSWGAWVCCLGNADSPFLLAGATHYDVHKIGIQSSERNSLYYIQIGFGTVAGAYPADVLTGLYTTIWYNPTALTGKSESITLITPHVPVATQIWLRCVCPNQNTATINFNLGGHEYLA